MFDITL